MTASQMTADRCVLCKCLDRSIKWWWAFVAAAGTFANLPAGTPHSFKNDSNKAAKMLISVAPAGLEQMFFEVGVPLAEGATTALPPTTQEIEKLLAVAPGYGITILLPGHRDGQV